MLRFSTYESARVNSFWTVFRNWLVALIPVAVFLTLESFFHFIITSRIIIPASVFFAVIQLFYNGLTETRINKVDIDIKEKRVRIQYYNIYEGKHERILPFADLQVKIHRAKRNWWDSSSVIDLTSKKYGKFSVTKHKDGFSKLTLEELADQLESLTTPVK